MHRLFDRLGLKALAAAALSIVFVGPALAQEPESPTILERRTNERFVGSSGGEFLKIPIGARGVAMGQAFTAVVDDISALWWNPAGLGSLGDPAAFFTNVNMPLDVQFNYVGAGTPVFGGRGVIGGAVGVLSMGEQEVTTVDQPGGTGATFRSWSSSTQISYAHNVFEWLTTGASVKWSHENIFGVSSNAFQVDLGTNYHGTFANRGLRVAVVVQNLGTSFVSEASPIRASAGPASYSMLPNLSLLSSAIASEEFRPPTTVKTAVAYYLVDRERSSLIVNGELANPRQLQPMVSLGGEWTQVLVPAREEGEVATKVAARAGYTYQTDEEGEMDGLCCGSESLRGLGVGAGLQVDFASFGSSFDYAFRDWGRLGGTNNFSVSVLF